MPETDEKNNDTVNGPIPIENRLSAAVDRARGGLPPASHVTISGRWIVKEKEPNLEKMYIEK